MTGRRQITDRAPGRRSQVLPKHIGFVVGRVLQIELVPYRIPVRRQEVEDLALGEDDQAVSVAGPAPDGRGQLLDLARPRTRGQHAGGSRDGDTFQRAVLPDPPREGREDERAHREPGTPGRDAPRVRVSSSATPRCRSPAAQIEREEERRGRRRPSRRCGKVAGRTAAGRAGRNPKAPRRNGPAAVRARRPVPRR